MSPPSPTTTQALGDARATLDGSIPFPEVVRRLLETGAEHYHVDDVALRMPFSSADGHLVTMLIPYEGLPSVASGLRVNQGARPALCHVPKHPGRIDDVGDPQAPRLHCGCFGFRHPEPCRKREGRNMPPPGIQVVHHELHHEVFGPFLLVVILEDEAALSHSKDRHLTIQNLGEAQRFIEALGQGEILRRHKGPDRLSTVGNGCIHGSGINTVSEHHALDRVAARYACVAFR